MVKGITAYILVVAKAGREYNVYDEIKKIKGVVDISITYGAWDLVIKVQVNSLPELDKVVSLIRKVKDIEMTTTLIGV